ncbi:MAG: T9SS type A sorting domain-containing protein [Bacteroidia bacterium]|nr:T9SS type A sorting domain-containing protein [Bacteroidia bacterium]
MKKIYTTILSVALFTGINTTTNAQCTDNRYHDYVFPAAPVVTSNIIYGNNLDKGGASIDLKLDVYQPNGDASNSRALIIVAHGGSFIGGSKTGSDVLNMSKDFARMGYVVASIDYRIGMTNFPIAQTHTIDSTDAGAAVMRAVHDGRAAVRYFRKDARIGGNTYKIDTNNIFFAGVSAGGFIALHVAYMDELSEFPSYVDTIGQHGLHGGIEGLSGNPGYPSDVKAVINICGALGDTAWVKPGDEPVMNFHGNNDGTVPYGSSVISLLGIYPLLKVHGGYSVAARANQVGLTNCFEKYENRDHVPHVGTSATALAHYDTTLTISRNFLEHFTCGVALNCAYTTPPVIGIDELIVNANDINLYPNPANTNFTIDLTPFGNASITLELFDILGKSVMTLPKVKNDVITLNRGQLPSGMYFVRLTNTTTNISVTKKVTFE